VSEFLENVLRDSLSPQWGGPGLRRAVAAPWYPDPKAASAAQAG